MPPAPAKAHADLDRAVDHCYRREPLPTDRRSNTSSLYEQLAALRVRDGKERRR